MKSREHIQWVLKVLNLEITIPGPLLRLKQTGTTTQNLQRTIKLCRLICLLSQL